MTRLLTKSVAALAIVGAMAIGTAAPSMAQGIYFGGPGFGVGVGAPWGYYHHPYYYGPYGWHHRHWYRSHWVYD